MEPSTGRVRIRWTVARQTLLVSSSVTPPPPLTVNCNYDWFVHGIARPWRYSCRLIHNRCQLLPTANHKDFLP